MNPDELPPKEDPCWSGWTRDPSLLPLKDMEKDGYTVEEVEDAQGKFWRIIKITLKEK